jgi:hypothetical protein
MDRDDDVLVRVLIGQGTEQSCPACAWVVVRGEAPLAVLPVVWVSLAQLTPTLVCPDVHVAFNTLPVAGRRVDGRPYADLTVRVQLPRGVWADVPIDMRAAMDAYQEVYAAEHGVVRDDFFSPRPNDEMLMMQDIDDTCTMMHRTIHQAWRLTDELGHVTRAEAAEIRYNWPGCEVEPDIRPLGTIVLDHLDSLFNRLGNLAVDNQGLYDEANAAARALMDAMAQTK